MGLGLCHLLGQSHHMSLQMWPEGQGSTTLEDTLAGVPWQQPSSP